MMNRGKIGELAQEKKWISAKDIRDILASQKKDRENGAVKSKTLFGKYLVNHEYCSKEIVDCLIVEQNLLGDGVVRYQVESMLGSGGMGIVYKAFDKVLHRHVALKIISRIYGEKSLQRFYQEAKAIAQLDHPNIVKLYDIEEDGYYLTMQYIKGNSLLKVIQNGNIEGFHHLANIFSQITDGLDKAHQNNIVHRDLKPSNVIISDKTKPYIIDFGLAKLTTESCNLTETGDKLGTPIYMSPEQMEGKSIDARSDIYSLGATLYQCLTKSPPFQGSYLRKEDPIFPRRLNSNIPIELEAICLKCLEINQNKRYQSALALGDDLKRYQENRPVQARPITALVKFQKWIHRNREIALTILLIIIGTCWAFWLINEEKNRAQEESTKALMSEIMRVPDFTVKVEKSKQLLQHNPLALFELIKIIHDEELRAFYRINSVDFMTDRAVFQVFTDSSPESIRSILRKKLWDRNPIVSSFAATLIGELKLFSEKKHLLRAINENKSWRLIRSASKALVQLEESMPLIPILFIITQNQNYDIGERNAAVGGLGEIGPLAAATLPLLLHEFNERTWEQREDIVLSLGRIGPYLSSRSPHLELIQNSSEWKKEWKNSPEKTIKKINSLVIEKLGKTLLQGPESIALSAALGFKSGKINPSISLSYLTQAYHRTDTSAFFQKYLLETIFEISPQSQESQNLLQQAHKNSNIHIQNTAKKLLGEKIFPKIPSKNILHLKGKVDYLFLEQTKSIYLPQGTYRVYVQSNFNYAGGLPIGHNYSAYLYSITNGYPDGHCWVVKQDFPQLIRLYDIKRPHRKMHVHGFLAESGVPDDNKGETKVMFEKVE